jgi:hypothetical protein
MGRPQEERGEATLFQIQYNLGIPTYMEPRYCRITENDRLLEKAGTKIY